MRSVLLSLAAASLAVPVSMAIPGSSAEARPTYKGKTTKARKVCRTSSGTTGLVAGGVTGAVVGSKVIGGGVVGAVAGAAGGALAGRAVDRTITAKKRCYYVNR